jgi:uncharacterized membrane protein
MFLINPLGGLLIVMVIATLLFIAYFKVVKKTWGSKLKEIKITDKIGIRKMYHESVTFGECEIGELFGSLKRIRELVSKEDFQKIVNAHARFSEGVADMYNIVFYAKELKIKDEEAAPMFEKARTNAIVAYHNVVELKHELNLDWADPMVTAYPATFL